jgi:phytoene desaturase
MGKKVLAPSCLLYYVGLEQKAEKCVAPQPVFRCAFRPHADEIYTHPKWPEAPLFYVNVPSRTDSTVAPPVVKT